MQALPDLVAQHAGAGVMDHRIAEKDNEVIFKSLVFAGATFEVEDTRRNYREPRIICFGVLHERIVVVGYTPRGADRHVFSMRKANDREKTRIAPLLGL